MNQHVEGTEVNNVDYFRGCVLEGRWEEVLELYKNKSDFHKIKINERRGTALHVTVNDGKVELVNVLVGAMIEHEGMELRPDSALRSTNKTRDTPLHIAASRGFTSMCKCIIGEHGERKNLIEFSNDEHETPLFQAVLTCQTNTFLYLHHVSKDLNISLRNYYGDTILHCAIWDEFLDLTIIITHCYPELVDNLGRYKYTPLQVLANKPSAFMSGNSLSWWKRVLYYYCILVEPLDAEKVIKSYMGKVDKFEDLEHKVSIPLENEAKKAQTFAVLPNSATSVRFVKRVVRLALNGLSVLGLGVTVDDLKAIKILKQKHEWSGQLLNVLMKTSHEWYDDDEAETAFLAAARNGIVEIVYKLHSKIPSVAHQINYNNENVLLVAVKNRQSIIVEVLRQNLDKKLFDRIISEVNDEENTVLHLAAGTSTTSNGDRTWTWQIAGTAMQMTWDIKWYEYMRDLVPDHFTFRKNREDKTAWAIFEKKHKDLMKESSEWPKETSNSCSVVAALIAGVSFATSSTVPGGTEKGKPTFEGQPAFDAFAIASLIGLSFSVTALIMFLSILTSRKQAEDFRKSLPLKLLFGLTSLFVSIASMLVSFCAAHFFVLKDKYKNILFPVYKATCLPVTLYAVVQFPLYFDLLKAILNKVPRQEIRLVIN